MAKLHELLAAEKTPNGAWNQLFEETLKKFKNPSHFFDGHSKNLTMIEDSPANKAIEAQALEEKPVTTTVYDTLEYALDIFGRAEDLQLQKNRTSASAAGDILWRGAVLVENVPCLELLGLESRLIKLRQLVAELPTLDATKHWQPSPTDGRYIWITQFPEETTKTEKQMIPVTLKESSKEHPAQVATVTKDVVVGRFTTRKRSGSATALQKADALKTIDELIIEIKQARMRANETVVEAERISDILLPLLMEPFETSKEAHQ